MAIHLGMLILSGMVMGSVAAKMLFLWVHPDAPIHPDPADLLGFLLGLLVMINHFI